MFYDLEREPGQPFSTESYLKFYIYLQLMILVFNCEYIFLTANVLKMSNFSFKSKFFKTSLKGSKGNLSKMNSCLCVTRLVRAPADFFHQEQTHILWHQLNSWTCMRLGTF